MSVDLTTLSKMIQELAENGESVEDAMAKCNERLKLLRHLRDMLDVKAEPAPRNRKKKEAVA